VYQKNKKETKEKRKEIRKQVKKTKRKHKDKQTYFAHHLHTRIVQKTITAHKMVWSVWS
jgi:hypothetical protein